MKKIIAIIIAMMIFFGVMQMDVIAAGSGPEAQYEKGMGYFENKDYDSAFSYFQISGEVKGYAPAQNMLGICYRDGLGTEQDLTEAERYFKLAADQGNTDAEANLSAIAEDQDGTYQNAMNLFFEGEYKEAKALFESLGIYERSKDFLAKCEEALNEVNKNRPVITSLTLDEKNRPVLVWDSVPNAASYRVYYSADNSSYHLLRSDVKTSLTSNQYYASGKIYYFKVLAIYTDGRESDYSDAKSITIPAIATPTSSPVQISAPRITGLSLNEKLQPTVQWSVSANASEYKLYRSTDNTKYSLVAVTAETEYTVLTCQNGKQYYFKVLAVGKDGTESSYSGQKSILIPAGSAKATLTPTPSGYIGTVNGSWNGKVYLNDSYTGIYELDEPIKNCKSLTMQVKFYNYYRCKTLLLHQISNHYY